MRRKGILIVRFVYSTNGLWHQKHILEEILLAEVVGYDECGKQSNKRDNGRSRFSTWRRSNKGQGSL